MELIRCPNGIVNMDLKNSYIIKKNELEKGALSKVEVGLLPRTLPRYAVRDVHFNAASRRAVGHISDFNHHISPSQS